MSDLRPGYKPVELYCLDGPLLALDGPLYCYGDEPAFIYEAPIITAAVITPNPADINEKVLLSVSVEDGVLYLEAEKYHSGEFYSGEV